MNPTWVSDCGTVKLWLGDCLAVMKEWPDGAVDSVVTDPPYGNNYSTGYRAGIKRASTRIVHDKLTTPILNDTANMLAPILNDTAAVYWCAAPDRLDMVLPIIKRHWSVVNVIAWDKGNCTAGDLAGAYGKQWEAIVYATRSKADLNGARDRDVWRIPRMHSSDYVHSTQKPIALMAKCIAKHDAKTIADPFMGSGTTGVAAVRLGRSFLGVEIDPAYFEIAKNRIKDELRKVAFLDGHASTSPIQGNLFSPQDSQE